MQRHQRHASPVLLATLVVGIVLALMGAGLAPAQAAGRTTPAQVHAVAASAPAVASSTHCRHAVRFGAAEGCAATAPQRASEGGCGFLQRCVYLNRTEQTYLISGSKWIVQAALCAGSLGIGCVVAGTIVEIAAQWLISRGGICPTSHPKLRVQYFPFPQVEGCVA